MQYKVVTSTVKELEAKQKQLEERIESLDSVITKGENKSEIFLK